MRSNPRTRPFSASTIRKRRLQAALGLVTTKTANQTPYDLGSFRPEDRVRQAKREVDVGAINGNLPAGGRNGHFPTAFDRKGIG